MTENLLILALLPLFGFLTVFFRNGAALLHQKSESSGAGILGILMFLMGFWTLSWIAEGLLLEISWKLWAIKFQLTALAFLVPSTLVFLGEINPLPWFGAATLGKKLTLMGIYFIPGITIILLWIDPTFIFGFSVSPEMGHPGWLSRSFTTWHTIYRFFTYGLVALLVPYLFLTLRKPELKNLLGIKRLVFILIFVSLGDLLGYLKILPSPWSQVIFAYGISLALAIFSSKRFSIFLLPPSALVGILRIWPQPLLIFDQEKRLIYCNTEAESLGITKVHLGVASSGLLGLFPSLAPAFSPSSFQKEPLAVTLGSRTFEVKIIRFSLNLLGFPGKILYFNDITQSVETHISLEELIQERTQELTFLNERVTEELEHRKKTEKDLHFFSVHDPLTALVNRGFFQEELTHVMERTRRKPEEIYAVVFTDFDGFKAINDTYGHLTGDEFLKQVAGRFKAAVRGSDTVSRFGGDEFVMLLTNLRSPEEALEITDRMMAELSIPMTIGGQRFVPSASFGLVQSAPEYQTPNEVIRDADIAMYHSKAQGKGILSVFVPQMRHELLERTWILEDLRQAMENGGIRLHFQPIVEIKTGVTCGFEALVRCQDRHGQEIPPPLLIQAAEESGLSVALGALILRRACETIMALRERRPSLDGVWISVNVASQQMVDDFVDLTTRILRETGLPPELLHLEITETAIISDFEHIFPVLEKLKSLGIHIKLDDFGTGYSSLSYLHRLPADSLKIDRSFVLGLESVVQGKGKRGSSESIIRAIIALGTELGYEIIVEGLETKAQVDHLSALGCRFAQGYYYSKPVSAAKLLESYPILEGVE